LFYVAFVWDQIPFINECLPVLEKHLVSFGEDDPVWSRFRNFCHLVVSYQRGHPIKRNNLRKVKMMFTAIVTSSAGGPSIQLVTEFHG
jgi:hypothetical protein